MCHAKHQILNDYYISPTKDHVVKIIAMSSQKSTYLSIGAGNGSGLAIFFHLDISFVNHKYLLSSHRTILH